MNYKAALDFLYSLTNKGIKLGLVNTKNFLTKLGAAEPKAAIIHIAGTNGKGSTAIMLQRILSSHAKKVGLFTSPHINDFKERIRINDEFISSQYIADFTSKYAAFIRKSSLTFFEVNTCLAVTYFIENNCDVIILETGLGGRLDATNCFKTKLCLLTPISLDHQDYLGDTLEEIAAEKAGIIKEYATVISSDTNLQTLEYLENVAKEKSAKWLSFLFGKRKKIDIPLLGEHQQRNASLALQAAEVFLESDFSEELALAALKKVTWQGRLQRWQKNSAVFLDVSHNPAGIEQTLSTLQDEIPKSSFSCLFAFLTDKDFEKLVGMLSEFSDRLILFPLENPRFDKESYKQVISSGQVEELQEKQSIEELIGNKDNLLVIGSHFLLEQFHLRFP